MKWVLVAAALCYATSIAFLWPWHTELQKQVGGDFDPRTEMWLRQVCLHCFLVGSLLLSGCVSYKIAIVLRKLRHPQK